MSTHSSSMPAGDGRLARSRSRSWRAVLVAALVAAVANAAFAFVAYVLVVHRFNFETLLQYIARGALGDAAFATGPLGIDTATVGFAVHATLAVVFTVFSALIVSPWVHTPATACVIGVAFGVGIWLFTNAVALPLGDATHEPFLSRCYLTFGMDHALLVGLPIALILYAVVPGHTGERA